MSSPLNFGGERTLATWLGAGFPDLTWCSDSDHRRAAVWGRDAGGRAKVWAARWWDGCMVDVIVYSEAGEITDRRRFRWPSSLEHGDAWSSLPAAGDVAPISTRRGSGIGVAQAVVAGPSPPDGCDDAP